jgi:hypothetical protein
VKIAIVRLANNSLAIVERTDEQDDGSKSA